ncbi:hypothetical protein CEXT_239221, partial [Caerostris extrusa]
MNHQLQKSISINRFIKLTLMNHQLQKSISINQFIKLTTDESSSVSEANTDELLVSEEHLDHVPSIHQALPRNLSPLGIKSNKKGIVTLDEIRKGSKSLYDLCIMCRNRKSSRQHPFFIGGICVKCTHEYFWKIALLPKGEEKICIVCGLEGQLVYCSFNTCL